MNKTKTVYLVLGGDGKTIDTVHGVYTSKNMAEKQFAILDENITYPNYELWIEEQTLNPKYESENN
jgi:hypothetical protein